MVRRFSSSPFLRVTAGAATALLMQFSALSSASAADVFVPVSRAELVSFGSDMSEVIVADPAIADVHNHGTRQLSIIGKKMGITNVRVLNEDGKLLNSYTVTVGYDLPAIRKALKNFLPEEMIGVEMVNNNIALTGQVSSANSADKAIRITKEFLKQTGDDSRHAVDKDDPDDGILNLMQVTSSQQVMLRVRVGEVNREALKELGIEWSNFGSPGNFFYQVARNTGVQRFVSGSTSAFISDATDTTNYLRGGWSNGSTTIDGLIKALEQDDLFRLLAEPNLVAVSGEEAEFLAGGEIPVPVPQANSGSSSSAITIEYKPFGVAVKFRPFVLSENRLRIEVQPEVSELDNTIAISISGFTVPGISTRRAKTTIEMAPGESFMIAGLIKDQTRSSIQNLPGAKEIPVLGALFRSTSFQRSETELVIAVTPYLVDPMRSGDVKLPTDNFAPASQMEMSFYGALGTLSEGALTKSQTPSLEGPIGYMVD